MGRLSMTWPQYKRRQCSVDGRPIQLSNQQFTFLTYLLFKPPGTIVYHGEMIEHMWSAHNEPQRAKDTLITMIWKFRKQGIPIKVIPGQGYMLERNGLTPIDYYFGERYKYPPEERIPLKYVQGRNRCRN